jgi:hypothetical protein
MGERSSVVTLRLIAVTDDVMACADVIACDGVIARTHDSSRMARRSFIKFGMISIPLEVSSNSYIFGAGTIFLRSITGKNALLVCSLRQSVRHVFQRRFCCHLSVVPRTTCVAKK